MFVFFDFLQIQHKNTAVVLDICKKNFAQGQAIGDGLELAAVCWVSSNILCNQKVFPYQPKQNTCKLHRHDSW